MTTITRTLPATPAGRPTVRTALRLTAMELRLLVRDPMVTVGLVALPMVMVLVLAGVFGDVPDPEFGGVAPDDHYVAGYVGVVLAALGLITIPVHLASHRELGVLRRFRAAGISGTEVVASQILVGTVLAIVCGVAVLAVGAAVYGVRTPENPWGVLGWFVIGLACSVAVGVALGTSLRSARAANAIGNLVFVPAFLLGGGGPPRAVMTGPMGTISDALPLTHVIGGIRQSWLGSTDDPHQVWWPVLVTLVCVAVAIRTARRSADHRPWFSRRGVSKLEP
ncbi:MAG: ABC transporter permease [Acidimicrobiales bacterium]